MRKPAYRRLPPAAQEQCNSLVAVMAKAEPTAFALEAVAVIVLRAQRCLEGWPWYAAHLEARDVVHVALNRVGAVRPSWQDGQRLPQYTETCEWCHAPFPPDDGRAGKYCSETCRVAALHDAHHGWTSEQRAEARADNACIICRTPLNATMSNKIYCSGWRCREKAWAAARAVPRECLWCRKPYRSYRRPAQPVQRFCSISCSAHWKWAHKGWGPRRVRAASAEARDV